MRRLFSPRAFLSLSLFAGVFVIGCGSDEKDDISSGEHKPVSIKRGGPKKIDYLEVTSTGTLKGRVIFDGTPPAEPEIKGMETHNDHTVCLAGKESEKVEQQWLIDPKTKGVANVFVKLMPPPGKNFKPLPPGKDEVDVDQPHCAYVPHVAVVKPGQKLKVMNSSSASHNTKVDVDPSANEGKNVTLPPGQSVPIELKPQFKPVLLSCQVHNWMSGQVWVPDHSYVAVTKADGTFEIPNVPAGIELAIVGLHEAGEVEGGKEGKKMTFKAGDNEVELKIKKK